MQARARSGIAYRTLVDPWGLQGLWGLAWLGPQVRQVLNWSSLFRTWQTDGRGLVLGRTGSLSLSL